MSGKGKKSKKSSSTVKNHGKRVLEVKGNMEEYGKISKKLGDKRMLVVLVDGQQMVAHIPGRFTKKKIWVDIDSVVLVSRREFENDKMDIIHLYEHDEVKKLVKSGEIPESFLQSGTSQIVSENIENTEGFDIEDSDEQQEVKTKPKVVVIEDSKGDFDFDEI